MTDKVIARVCGGLGNQMFIYAMARAMAERGNSELVLDTVSGFERDHVYNRRYMLDRFGCAGRPATPYERMEPFSRLRRRLRRGLNQMLPLARRNLIVESGKSFDPRIVALRPRGDLYLEGYWQSERYFADYASMIREELTVAPLLTQQQQDLADTIAATPSVALHLRFFDSYEDIARRAVLLAYYSAAMTWIEAHVPGAIYYLFSDRPTEAQQLLGLPADRCSLVENDGSDAATHADLWLIGRCRHAIIADSTFSWWAAWLGETAGTLIVAPRLALSGRSSAWGFEGLLPPRWHVIG